MNDVESFKTIRSQCEDPDSLVPVGHKEEVGFVSDEVRKALLDEKIQKQHDIRIKSNLKTPNDAIFGAGYLGKDGKTVVGAAHGLDEMLKMAEKSNKRYSDTQQLTEAQKREKEHLDKLKIEYQIGKIKSVNSLDNTEKSQSSANNGIVDLLDFGNDDDNQNVVNGTDVTTAAQGFNDISHSDILSFNVPEPTPEPTTTSPDSPEIAKSPSLPYPFTKEEAYMVPTEKIDDESGHENPTLPDTGGVFSAMAMNQINTAMASTNNVLNDDPHQDLLNLSTPSFPPPTSTKSGILMQDNLVDTIGNLSLNGTSNNANDGNFVSESPPDSVLDVISSKPGNTASSAISAMDMLAPMGGSPGAAMNNKNKDRPPTPVDSPPPLPPVSPPSSELRASPIPMGGFAPPLPPKQSPPSLPSVSPPTEPRASPIPMGGFAPPPPPKQSPPSLPPVSAPTEPRSSPIPMGGISHPTQPYLATGNMSSSPATFAPTTPAPVPSQFSNDFNASGNNMMNSMNQQQDMMMMLMNQQQQMMQHNTSTMGGMNNNNNQQAQMMQQMMMMNQQMMQQLMSMQSQPQMEQQHQQQPASLLLQQQQQMMSLMMQQQQASNNNSNNIVSNNGNSQASNSSTNTNHDYPASMNPFS